MTPIHAQHLNEPGLAVLDITAHNGATLTAMMSALEQLWATSGLAVIRRVPSGPGVSARVYVDTRRDGPRP